jgi:hypothetical protein
VLGLQYAALAKNVKGLNAEICEAERVVIVCLFNRSDAGAARTVTALKSATMVNPMEVSILS